MIHHFHSWASLACYKGKLVPLSGTHQLLVKLTYGTEYKYGHCLCQDIMNFNSFVYYRAACIKSFYELVGMLGDKEV